MENISPEALGVHLARLSFELMMSGEQALHTLLHGCGFPGTQDQIYYFSELSLFCMFPFDLIASAELPVCSERVRGAMRSHLRQTINVLRKQAGLPSFSEGHWEQHVGTRFGEYASALRNEESVSSLPPEYWLAKQVAGILSVELREDMQAISYIVLYFVMVMQHMPATIRGYRVED
jgi:hypothetical protein